MTEAETKIETEAEDFTDELSDEALDREERFVGSVTVDPCKSDR